MIRRACTVLVATLLLCSAVGSAAAAPATTEQQAQTEDATSPVFVVTLRDDGSADVTVTYTFDLSDDVRQAAFEELRTNETAVRAFEDRFRRQLQGVASEAASATGREMSVTGVDVAVESDGETGIVRVTATWEGLAATDGDRLTVTEPFASGFEPDRTFVVVVPEGYAVDGVTPSPDERADGRVVWASGTDLSGFEMTASPADTSTATPASDDDGGDSGDSNDDQGDDSSDGDDGIGGTTGQDGPGFGVTAGVLAVLAAALIAARRR